MTSELTPPADGSESAARSLEILFSVLAMLPVESIFELKLGLVVFERGWCVKVLAVEVGVYADTGIDIDIGIVTAILEGTGSPGGGFGCDRATS